MEKQLLFAGKGIDLNHSNDSLLLDNLKKVLDPFSISGLYL